MSASPTVDARPERAGRETTRRPDVFIVGAPKTGTTSLYEYLQEHPDVFMSPVKEPSYFSPDVRVRPARRYQYRYPEDQAKYDELFADARDEKRLGEASTTYLMSVGAPGRIHEYSPDARIIAMVRNPVDLVYSLHNERVSNGLEWMTDFEQAMAADEARRRGEDLPHNLEGFGVAYRDNAYLGEQLQRWLDEFGPDRVHVILFDEFAKDTPGHYRRVLEFLDVDPDFQPASFAVHNVSHRRRGGIVQGLFANPVGRFVSRKLLPKVLGQARTARNLRRVRQSPLMRRKHERQPLRPELRKQLQDEFTPDVELLGRLLGRDLRSLWFGERETR
ncbi:MAG TPA: sulfotransferase [Candidatus Limnocylindrales bacterium]|nr:sulfotransferase [Candidatus Limnocylindrales bacterium]